MLVGARVRRLSRVWAGSVDVRRRVRYRGPSSPARRRARTLAQKLTEAWLRFPRPRARSGRLAAPCDGRSPTLTRACTLALVLLVFAGDAAASELIGRDGGRASLQVNGAGQGRRRVAEERGDAPRRRRERPQRSPAAARDSAGLVPAPLRGALDRGRRAVGLYDGPPLAWLGRRLRGYGRLLLGAAALVAPEAELRRAGLPSWETPALALVGTAAGARDLDGLGLPPLRPSLRPATPTGAAPPAHGFRVTPPQGNPLDDYGRNVSWTRRTPVHQRVGAGRTGFLAQRPNGAFCYGLYPHGSRPSGKGTQYRATVIGPGVVPDVIGRFELKSFDRAREQRANAHQRQLFADRRGNGCKPALAVSRRRLRARRN